MLAKQRMTLDLFTKVNSFIDSKPAVLASAPDGYNDQVAAFKTALGIIQQATATQVTGSPSQMSAQRQAARQALRIGQLHPLRKIARVLERSVAGMPHLVDMPKKGAGTQKLLAAARVVVQDVTPYQAQFVTKGMPSDFLDQLNQSIQTLQDTDSASARAQQIVKQAKGQLATAMLEARDAVTCLDVIVRRACAADPANGGGTLEVWNGILPPPAKLTVLGSPTPSAVIGSSTNSSGQSTAGTAASTAPPPASASADASVAAAPAAAAAPANAEPAATASSGT